MHIAVIGAGAAGLCAARHALANNFQVSVFEQTKEIGGVWVYTDQIGTDENGLDIERSMYQGLRTNIPKEIMGFPDCPMTEPDESYIPAEKVLEYLNNYAEKFRLRECIKFEHYVIRVHPKDDKWEVIVNDMKNGKLHILNFDAVMVCNGHYAKPSTPKYIGQELFEGIQMHSHHYRCPEEFCGHDILVIGCGPSALDIIFSAEKKAKSVTISTHTNFNIINMFSKDTEIVPDLTKITKNGAEFANGVHKSFSKIIYCTGYLYSFPFLSTHCDIKVDDNYVYPLFKHCFNIEQPTMIFLGLLTKNFPFSLMDMQARVFMEYLKKNITLPTKEEMLRETEEKMQTLWNSGHKKRHSHWFFGLGLMEYIKELSELGKIETIKPAIIKLFYENQKQLTEHFDIFRTINYKLVDDETFLIINN